MRRLYPCGLCRDPEGKRVPRAEVVVCGVRLCERHAELVEKIKEDAA